jgi:hypothetical protein
MKLVPWDSAHLGPADKEEYALGKDGVDVERNDRDGSLVEAGHPLALEGEEAIRAGRHTSVRVEGMNSKDR